MKEFTLHSNRIRIRKIELSDLDAFISYRSNPEVTQFQGFDVMNEKQAIEFIEQNQAKDHTKDEWQQLAIVLNETNQLIGDCALKVSREKYKVAHVGITIHPDFQQKGYAIEVFTILIKYLFEDLKTQRIIETVLQENKASIALLKKARFKFDSELPSDDSENIELQYSMLSSDWKKFNL